MTFDNPPGGGGGFNDVVLALDIGADNVNAIVNTVGAPEPAICIELATYCALGAGMNHTR